MTKTFWFEVTTVLQLFRSRKSQKALSLYAYRYIGMLLGATVDRGEFESDIYSCQNHNVKDSDSPSDFM